VSTGMNLTEESAYFVEFHKLCHQVVTHIQTCGRKLLSLTHNFVTISKIKTNPQI